VIGTEPSTRAATAPLAEADGDRDELDAALTAADGADGADRADAADGADAGKLPLVQARRYVIADDPLDQARRFEVVRQSIAERSAARRFELAVDPPDDEPSTPNPRGATC